MTGLISYLRRCMYSINKNYILKIGFVGGYRSNILLLICSPPLMIFIFKSGSWRAYLSKMNECFSILSQLNAHLFTVSLLLALPTFPNTSKTQQAAWL